MTEPAPNQTASKFGYPGSLVARYDHWVVLARPQQPVLGATVLLCTDDAKAFSQISPAAFAELARVTADLETALRSAFQPDKFNYLMLMMVDPDVHFHVLPRYEAARDFAGRAVSDPFWPKPVDLTQPVVADAAMADAVRDQLRAVWRQTRS